MRPANHRRSDTKRQRIGSDRPLRVLVAADLFGPGGTESHLLNLCRLLRSNGAEITLATRLARPGVPLLSHVSELKLHQVGTPFARRLEWFKASQLWAYVAWPLQLRSDYDVLYTYGVGRYTSFMARFVRPAGRVMWHPFGDPRDFPSMVRRMPAGIVDAIIAESSLHAAAFREHVGDAVEIPVLPALAFTSTAPMRTRRVIHNEVRIAFLGRFDENKGVTWLVDQWPALNIQPARLDVYGDGPLREVLLTKAAALGGKVSLHRGWSDAHELGEILAKTDVVVLPSASEGVPLTLLECIAHGVPFVASAVGGIPTLADDNPDVRVAPQGALLARALEAMVKDLREGLIDNARLQKYFSERFAPQRVASRWLAFMYSGRSSLHPSSRHKTISPSADLQEAESR